MAKTRDLVIGVDYGTDSVRSLIVDSRTGREIASAVHPYSRWREGKYCQPAKNRFRQHPRDYIEGLEKTVRKALAAAPKGTAAAIRGIAVDTTGSTPCAVDKTGTPLSLTKGFEENPNAMFILWKDHTAVGEAAEINSLAHSGQTQDFTKFVGGIYSSEWFWAKILHTLRVDDKVAKAAWSWVEHCDWIPALLTGCRDSDAIKRGRCSAGHKAMWHPEFDGLPAEEFLTRLDSRLSGLRSRLYRDTFTSDRKAGTLSTEWADRLGLSTDVAVAVGAFDAHMGAVGGGIQPYQLVKVIGTSTCDMLIAPSKEMDGKLIRGICGQVDGSIIPGMLGMEAGQSAFGDIYAWWKNVLAWPVEKLVKAKNKAAVLDRIIPALTEEARKRPIDPDGILSVDWMNGRRTPDANQLLKGAVAGLNLASDAPGIFRSLVEATAFGAKKIADRFVSEGVAINSVLAIGGVARKSAFVMQVLADVLGMPIKVSRSEQACALGAAMFAAVAAGLYTRVEESQKAMAAGYEKEYKPDPAASARYAGLYDRYTKISSFIESITGGL